LTTNQILTGVGLIFALAAGSQVLASRLRFPAIIVLLPVGFVAGALTPDVDPQRLLGPAFEPLAAATGRGARLEGITAVLLLTDEDDFNALASVLLADTVGERVYRLAPPQRSHGVVAPPTPQPGDTLVSLGPALAAQPADPGRSELPEVER
jgi:hypothetical protein